MRSICYLLLFASSLAYTEPLVASVPPVSGSEAAEETPQCYDPNLIPPRPTIAGHLPSGQRWLLADFFEQPQLSNEYQLSYGRGSYGIARSGSHKESGSLVYELPPTTVLANEGDYLNVDPLGRTYAPSLLVARPWTGEEWTFDTQVTYGAAQSCNGCNVFLWVAFNGVPQRHQNSIRIQRSITGNPQQSGELTVTVLDAAGTPAKSTKVPLNARDSYFFRVTRHHREVEILVSSDGTSYNPLISYAFGHQLDDSKQQWLVANGLVFMGGCAYEAFRYFSVRGTVEKLASRMPLPVTRWRVHGQPNRYIDLSVQQLDEALRRGNAVDVRFANIKGELNFNRLQKTAIDSQLTFRDSHFEDNIIGSYLTFANNVVFVDCDIGGSVELYDSKFEGRADFSGSTLRGGSSSAPIPTLFSNDDFRFGADFSGVTFKTKPTFRLSKFRQSVSFWRANFERGGDLSGVTSFQDTTFADFSFSKPDISPDNEPDMLFFGSVFSKRVLFISTFTRPNPILGREISFQGSRIDELIFSGGSPDIGPGSGQEGPAMWSVVSGLSLREATVRRLLIKDVAFMSRTEPVDLREISFECSECGTSPKPQSEAFQLVNTDFNNLRLSQWPVGSVLADAVSARRLVSALESTDPALARVSYFDLVPISRYYDTWRRDAVHPGRSGMRDRSFHDYIGYKIERWFFGLFWLISGYGTSFWRTMATGLALTSLFAIVFFLLDRGRGYLVRIDKPLELRSRFPETPVLSFGESPHVVASPLIDADIATNRARTLIRGAFVAVVFSLNTVLKIGFGNLRVQTKDPRARSLFLPFRFPDATSSESRSPRGLVATAWVGWAVGYGWYLLLVYTVIVIPVLKGLF
jgi:hypothetical protein